MYTITMQEKIEQTKIYEDAKKLTAEVPEKCNMMHCTNFADMFSTKISEHSPFWNLM
jgi:hypothetical protein